MPEMVDNVFIIHADAPPPTFLDLNIRINNKAITKSVKCEGMNCNVFVLSAV